jgi:protein MpaA
MIHSSGRIEMVKKHILTFILCGLTCWFVLADNPEEKNISRSEVTTKLPEGKQPAVKSMELGKSVQGREIRMHIFGNDGPVVLIFAGIHGDEPESQYVALCLVDYLMVHPELYADRRVAIIPTSNPDGIFQETRVNANHVDCNRNFPASNWEAQRRVNKFYGGAESGSEPETKAIMLAVEALKPTLVISIHVAIKDIVPFCMDPDNPSAQKYAEIMSKHNGYPVIEDMGYDTPGSFGTWAAKDRDIPTITLELRDFQPWPELWSTHRDALVAVIKHAE